MVLSIMVPVYPALGFGGMPPILSTILMSATTSKLARAACKSCHGTKSPQLTAFFLFLSFLQEGVIVVFRTFCMGF
jgi:hypothetical protein